MVVRFLRSGRWEIVGAFVLTSVISLILALAIYLNVVSEIGETEARLWAASVFLLVTIGSGYWSAQRIGRRIETMNLSLKQISNGNYSIRITERRASSFTVVYQEFNELAEQIEEKMKWLQMRA